MGIAPICINTCVFGTGKMDRIPELLGRYPGRLGFEILSMFDLPDFEPALRQQLDALASCPVSFHGPVYECEHSAARGTEAYERTMFHVRKTLEYARLLHSRHFTMHLNNCLVLPRKKDEMLQNALENYEELRCLFEPFGCRIFVENTGTRVQGNMLLDQAEFTDVCRANDFEVLIDIGHANANGWDISRLIDDLKDRIRAYHLHNNDGLRDQHRRLHDGTLDFDAVIQKIRRDTPEADLIIEYVSPALAGKELEEDLKGLLEAE
nr:sugar phosphate isomerase/epimerase [Lachnospiraceae bacterium]